MTQNSANNYNQIFNHLNGVIDKHVWLICSPKSGSTWLSRVMGNLLGFTEVPLVPEYGSREQEADVLPLLFAGARGKVFSPQQHCRYSNMTGRVAAGLDSRIILQFRNIFDTIISVNDHFNSQGVGATAAYLNQEYWDSYDPEKRLWFLVDLVTPWFINFYISWYTSPYFSNGKAKIITYEELNQAKEDTVRTILEFIEEEKTDEEIKAAFGTAEEQFTRKNTAIIGRGKELPSEMRGRIISYTRFYSDIDFSLIGL